MALHSAFIPVGAPAGLVALTRDPALVAALRVLAEDGHHFEFVASDTALTDHLMASATRAALIDGAAASVPVAQLTDRLKAQFPDLVLVVAGTAADQGVLAPLITDGRVFRFLHKPVSAQRVKLFVESAFRHSDAMPPTPAAAPPARSSGARSRLPLVLGGLSLAIVAAVAIWWAMREPAPATAPTSSGTAPADAARAGAAAPAPAAPSDLDPATQRVLERADAALAAGQLVSPPGESAADLYRLVLAKSPAHARATAGLDAVTNRLLADAEQAIVAEDLDSAAQLVDVARGVLPEHPRVAFLTAQIGKERERQLLTTARQAAASGNLDRAIAVLERGSSSGSELIGAAKRELQQQEIDLQAASFLALADARMQAGALVDPAQDNARYYIESARALAPEHAGLREAQRKLQVALVAAARDAIGAGDFAAAELGIATGAENGVARSELDALRRELAAAQVALQADEFTALAQRFNAQLRANRLLEPAADSALALYGQMREANAQHPQTLAARNALGSRMLGESRVALARSDVGGAQRWVGEAEAIGFTGLELTNAKRDIATQQARAQRLTEAVPVGQLTRTRTIEPRYPPAAQSAGQEGWVDLEFTVTRTGTVEDVQVIDASPAGVFDEAASDAVARWRFRPVEANGVAVPQRAKLRMRFDLQ
jgi:protein TonB